MNILGDFIARVDSLYPDIENEELDPLLTTIKNQEEELERKDRELEKFRLMLAKFEAGGNAETPITETKVVKDRNNKKSKGKKSRFKKVNCKEQGYDAKDF